MILPFENDTRSMIKKLAKRSLKANVMRDLLIGFIIMLAVALLSGFVLSILGMQTETNKWLQVSNHVLYRNVDDMQMQQLRNDKRISDTLLIKQAPSTRIENYFVIPIYIEQKNSNIAAEKIVKGHYPEQFYEAAVDKAYLKQLGLPEELGAKITIPFYDGNTETFTVVGLTDSGLYEHSYSLYCSKIYAESGSQLKNASAALAVQLTHTDEMSEAVFKKISWQIGEDYGISHRNSDINDTFAASLSFHTEDVFIITIVFLGVLFVSYLVIYSIFSIYVQNQVREFGQLRTIGATKKQIHKMIHQQGRILCILGSAAGLPIGYLFAYFFKPNGWKWENTIISSIDVFLFAYFIIFISIHKPAKIAGSISPIEAMNSTGYIADRMVSKKLHRKITPISLAIINISRNKKKAVITILSLGVSGIMFLAGTTMLSSLNMERFIRHGLLNYGEFEIFLSKNAEKNNSYGQTGVQQNSPFSDEFIQTISKLDGVDTITAIKNLQVQYEYRDVQEQNKISPFIKEEQDLLEQYLVNGTIDYDAMCSNNEIILLRNEYSQIVHGWKFQVGDKVKIRWYDGKKYQEEEYKICGEISDNIFKTEKGGKAFTTAGYFLMPDVMLKQMMIPGFNLTSNLIISINDFSKEPDIRKELNDFISDNPFLMIDALYDYYQESKVLYQRIQAVIFGISGFCMVFATINLINTLIANILSRKHEFSILCSVGMSKRQFQKTIQYESLILAFWNVIITLIFGGSIGFGIIHYLNFKGDNTWVWKFPVWYFIIYLIISFFIPLLISTILIQILKKKTLVEQLREVS